MLGDRRPRWERELVSKIVVLTLLLLLGVHGTGRKAQGGAGGDRREQGGQPPHDGEILSEASTCCRYRPV